MDQVAIDHERMLDGKVRDENLYGEFSRDNDTFVNDEAHRYVGDVCVVAARFRSGVEVGYRQLPPLTKFVWVEGHMPSLFSGLRAAVANGSSNRNTLRTKLRTQIETSKKSKPNSRRSSSLRYGPVCRVASPLQADAKPKRVELANCRRTRCRPTAKPWRSS